MIFLSWEMSNDRLSKLNLPNILIRGYANINDYDTKQLILMMIVLQFSLLASLLYMVKLPQGKPLYLESKMVIHGKTFTVAACTLILLINTATFHRKRFAIE